MSTLTLQDAANYIRTSRAPKAFLAFLSAFRRIFTFTQERDNRVPRYVAVTRAYKAGQPVASIREQFGCSQNTVNRYARMAELPRRPKHLPEEIRKAVIADYKRTNGDGSPLYSVVSLASLHNVSPAYVSKVARDEGISRYEPRPKRRRRS